MATCWLFCRASASLSGASRPAGISVPILTARIRSMARSADALLGRRYRIAQSSPWATAATAGISQLPRWLAKNQRRLAVIAELLEQLARARIEFDAARLFGMGGIVVPDVIEMGEFGADAAEIVPDAGQNCLDLFGGLFRERRRQIRAADPVLAQPAADEAGDAAEKIGGLVGIEIARRAQQPDRQRADGGFRHRLGGVAKAGSGAEEQAVHGKDAMTLSREIGPGWRQENLPNDSDAPALCNRKHVPSC